MTAVCGIIVSTDRFDKPKSNYIADKIIWFVEPINVRLVKIPLSNVNSFLLAFLLLLEVGKADVVESTARFCPSSYKELVRVYGSVQKQEHTQKIRPPSLGLYNLFFEMEGERTENFIRILISLRYRVKIRYGSGFFHFLLQIRIRVPVLTQFLSTFKNFFLC